MAITACAEVFEAFQYATENLDNYIYRTASYRSIWLNLIERGTYPLGVGTLRTLFQVANVEPTADTSAWQPIRLSGQGNLTSDTTDDTVAELCGNDWNDVTVGLRTLQYGPEIRQMRGPLICKKDLLFSHDPDSFLRAYVEELTKRAKREWELNYEAHHAQFARKAFAVSAFEDSFTDSETMPTNIIPTCELTQEILEIVANHLMQDGATTPDSNGFITWQDGGPVFSLYIDAQQSQNLLRRNTDLRNDYRFADPNSLIARLGANRVIGNFRHIINQRPRRANVVNGALAIVPRYAADTSFTHGSDGKTAGQPSKISSTWKNALYEEAIVLSPYLFKSEIVPPKNAAGGIAFNPTSYMGEWKFVTGGYRVKGNSSCDADDPMDQLGRHFAEFIHAARPNPAARFKYGYSIWYKRCLGNTIDCVTCSS